jgi:4-hydroxy-3-methylbut-2-enyl diphosphate reductase
VIAIGGRASANTRKLVQAAQEEGVPAHQVEFLDDLQPSWFAGVQRVGITAGASTPDSVVDEVEERIRSFQVLRPVLA